MSSKTLSALLLLAALFGCTQERRHGKLTASASRAGGGLRGPPPKQRPEVTANPIDEDDPGIVVADDLKEKATQQISETNLESQLDELEKEIGKSE